MPALSQKTKGILYVVVAAFGFSMMSVFVKLSGDLPAFQKAFFRNFIALLFILAMMPDVFALPAPAPSCSA